MAFSRYRCKQLFLEKYLNPVLYFPKKQNGKDPFIHLGQPVFAAVFLRSLQRWKHQIIC